MGAYKAYGGIYVNWSSATGAKGYVLYRRVGSGKWTKIKTTKSRDFVDRTAKKGKTYQYKVVAINGKYKSASFTSDKIKR